MYQGMIFREIISYIFTPGSPHDQGHVLLDTVHNPKELHSDGFTSFFLDRVIGNLHRAFVVNNDRGERLGVVYF